MRRASGPIHGDELMRREQHALIYGPPVKLGPVERHYLRCPHCHGWADLETHCCSTCGAEALYVVWSEPKTPVSPELVMVSRER